MKKIFGLTAAIVITLFMAVQSHASITLDNTAAGVGINKTLNTEIGVTSFIFSPSPQVWLRGYSAAAVFAAAAVHNQAMGTGGGKAYGMAYDSTQVFWRDAEPMQTGANPGTAMLIDSASNSKVAFNDVTAWK